MAAFKPVNVEVTPLPTAKPKFRVLREEAECLAAGEEGRSLIMQATDTTGNPMVYVKYDGTINVGLLQKPEDIAAVFELVRSGTYSAHLSGIGEGGRITVSVRESETSAMVENNEQKGKDIEALIVANGILTQDELDERIEYLKEIGIDKKNAFYYLILLCIKPQKNGAIPKPKTLYKVVGKKEGNPIAELLIGIANGENVILEGPKSVGKNVIWETVGWLLNSTVILLQCNGRMTKAEMFGFEATDNSAKNSLNENGLSHFLGIFSKKVLSKDGTEFALNLAKSMSPTLVMENGSILEALERANNGCGAILVLDEMNLSEPNTLSGAINDIADGHTPEIFVAGKGVVPVNRKNFILGATQNGTGGDFVGTRKQNDATMSRFSCIKMKTPNSIMPLLRQMHLDGLEESVYDKFDAIYKEYKTGVESGIYPMSCLNIRGFKAALKRVSVGRDIKASISICVNNTVPNAEDTALLDSAVENILG